MLGTAQFGSNYGIVNEVGQINVEETSLILNVAKKSNVVDIDMAMTYGNSEVHLAQYNISQFNVFSKLPEVPLNETDVNKWIIKRIKSSMENLKITQFQGMLLHRPQQLLEPRGYEIYETLKQLQEHKKIKKIGISIYSPHELGPILENYKVDIIQAPISIIDRRLEKSGWLQQLNESGVEIHARSIFLQGLLLSNQKQFTEKFKAWRPIFCDWQEWLSQNPETDAAQACLSYVCNKANIDKIVVGIDNLKQFEELIEISKHPVNISFPNIFTHDEKLLHPSNWNLL